jgi:hypothetical protein
VALVRRVEAAAEQPDLHAGIGQRKVAPHVVRRILARAAAKHASQFSAGVAGRRPFA